MRNDLIELGFLLVELRTLMIARATTNSDRKRYEELRAHLLADSRISRRLPSLIKKLPTLDDFWKFIQKEKTYEERRQYLWDQFESLLQKLDEIGRPTKVFIGHGHSPAWRSLKDFVGERLKLKWDEFNRESAAGIATQERLQRMLDEAAIAFLVLTAEDNRTGDSLHARDNVIHELGLFQGKLGFQRAIILLEEGCERFSNIEGTTFIGFPNGQIERCFEEIRRVLEREHIL